MSESKINVKVGIVEFSGEGSQDWLAEQLDKILLKVPELLKIEMAVPSNGNANNDTNKGKATSSSVPKNLAIFLKDKSATSNQTKKFLAVAAFLQMNGKTRLVTGDIVKSLKDSNQIKLSNPSQYLNDNIAKGFCEKDTNNFFVTSEGIESLGIDLE